MELFNLGENDKISVSSFYTLIVSVVGLLVWQPSHAQYSLTETGQTITFAGVDASSTPSMTSGGTSPQLDSDLWAVDLENDNVFGTSSVKGIADPGFGSDFAAGVEYTADNGSWSNYNAGEEFFSYNYDLGGLGVDFPAVGMAISGNGSFTNLDYALISKFQNTSSFEFTEISLTLDAYYYYTYFNWYGVPDGRLGIYYATSATNITSDPSSLSWTEVTTLTNNGETSTGWKEFTTSTYSINSISVSTNEYIYLKFVFSSNGEASNPNQALAIDNITVLPTGFGGTDSDGSLVITAEGQSTISSTTDNQDAFSFSITDSGSDGVDTKFSDLIISEGSDNSVTDWSSLIETITITDSDGGNTATGVVSSSSNTITFSSLASAGTSADVGFVGNGSSNTYTINLNLVDTYSGTQDIEDEVLQFSVNTSNITASGVTSYLTSSEFITSNTTNILQVVASSLRFVGLPDEVGAGITFGCSVELVDGRGHLDKDQNVSYTLTDGGSGGTYYLSGGPTFNASGVGTGTFTTGRATFTDFEYSSSGVFSLTLSSTGFTDVISNITSLDSWRSLTGGDWTTSGSWEFYNSTTSAWDPTHTSYPDETDTDGPIFILSGHTITLNVASLSANAITVEGGGILVIDENFTLDDDGTSNYDLTIENGGELQINTGFGIDVSGGSTVNVLGGGKITAGSLTELETVGTSTSYEFETDAVLEWGANANFAPGTTNPYFPNANGTDKHPILSISQSQNYNAGFDGFVLYGILDYNYAGNAFTIASDVSIRDGVFGTGNAVEFHANADISGSFSNDTLFFGGTMSATATSVGGLTISSGQVVDLSSNLDASDAEVLFTFKTGSALELGTYSFASADLTVESGVTITSSAANGLSATTLTTSDINAGADYIFNGTAAQTTNFSSFGSTTNASDLTIDNSSGVTMNSVLSLSGDLTLTNGSLTTSATTLTLASSSNISGASSSQYVVGSLSRSAYTGSQEFPIGVSTHYRPATINPGTSSAVTAEYTRSDPIGLDSDLDTDGTTNPASLNASGYWTLTFGATGTVDITLEFDTDETGSSNLVIAKLDTDGGSSGEWVAYAASSFTSTSVTASVTIDDLSDVQFAVGTASSSLLPIELKSFEATWTEGSVTLDWITATEKNNDYFEVMRSPDAQYWEVLTMISGAGNSNQEINYQWVDEQPFETDNYYRLRQVDYDGTEEQHKIVWINNQALYPSKLIIYGNPLINATLDFELVHVDRSTPVLLGLMDVAGRKIKSISITEPGRHSIELGGLHTGTYLLRAQVGDQWFFKRFFKQ